MRLVSPVLKHAVYPVLHQAGYFRRGGQPFPCIVVNYHGVVPSDYSADALLDGNLVSAGSLRQQLRFLKHHYDVITPWDFRAWLEHGVALPQRAVLITCDDGLLNTLTDMLPVLREENISCLFFVTGASCSDDPGMLWYEELFHRMRAAEECGVVVQPPGKNGGTPFAQGSLQARWWEIVRKASRLPATDRDAWLDGLRDEFGRKGAIHPEKRWRLLNVDELRQMASAGMSIGAHTLSHPVLSECDEQEARREIEQSKTGLERTLGQRVWALAYPFGTPSTVTEREMCLARNAGYKCAFLNVRGSARDRSEMFGLSRTHVTASMRLAEFEAHLTGFHTRLQTALGR